MLVTPPGEIEKNKDAAVDGLLLVCGLSVLERNILH